MNINFMRFRKPAAILSAVLLVLSVIALFAKGLNLGLDFTGGTQVRVAFSDSVPLDTVRQATDAQGFTGAVVVYYGSESEVMIRFQNSLEDLAVTRLNTVLAEAAPGAAVQSVTQDTSGTYQSQVTIAGADNLGELADRLFPPQVYGPVEVRDQGEEGTTFMLRRSVDDPVAQSFVQALSTATGQDAELKDLSFVGSQVGDEMAENAVIGLLTALAIVMLYVSLRFQYKFAVSAVAALAHDVLIVTGIFAISGLEVDLTVFAALLAVIGYSINDTIVVADRIRENFRKIRKSDPVDVMNTSLNQTLGRTIVTSLTTILVLVALYLFGGDVIRGFALALIVGIIVGTYSSNLVVSNILLAMKVNKEDLMIPVKEGAEFDENP
ncbi:protein translocase subunit SecF [Gilvimarinus sp. DZF01]|uniref:protein translocase subunit SecF n=1 Tax=Gilvimarinus sp. DZF01 TaxID=3461371 RepID=UPI004046477C